MKKSSFLFIFSLFFLFMLSACIAKNDIESAVVDFSKPLKEVDVIGYEMEINTQKEHLTLSKEEYLEIFKINPLWVTRGGQAYLFKDGGEVDNYLFRHELDATIDTIGIYFGGTYSWVYDDASGSIIVDEGHKVKIPLYFYQENNIICLGYPMTEYAGRGYFPMAKAILFEKPEGEDLKDLVGEWKTKNSIWIFYEDGKAKETRDNGKVYEHEWFMPSNDRVYLKQISRKRDYWELYYLKVEDDVTKLTVPFKYFLNNIAELTK